MSSADWPAVVTPNDIARVLGISPKTLRAWLRANRAEGHAHGSRWEFTPAEADVIVARYSTRR